MPGLSNGNAPSPRQMLRDRICQLSIHDESVSTDDVLVNFTAFPAGLLKPSDLLSITPFDSRVIIQDFQDEATEADSLHDDDNRSLVPLASNRSPLRQSDSSDAQRKFTPEDAKCLIFVAQDLTPTQRSRHPKSEISVSQHTAHTFGFRNRSQVNLSLVERDDCTASHVEISFRDQYLTRSDMWRLATSELCSKAIYKGQRIRHLGTIKATVKNVYLQGHKVKSAYFGGQTKPVFRSESARYVLFIQMSKEMWDFDSDGSGEIMFDKVISGFLPELFKRWTLMGVKHLVTIVLFTRVEYELNAPIVISPDLGFHGVDNDGKPTSERPPYKDFYRIVVNEMASGEWTTIMFKLRKEYLRFKRDVSTQTTSLRERTHLNTALSLVKEDAEASVPRITGGPSAAIHGNILEAIALASSHFSSDYLDRDLVRTGISIVILTPGTAIFEVDKNVLRITTDTVIGNGIGLDIVCLSKMPLHSVPLFKYREVTPNVDPLEHTAELSDRHFKGTTAHGSYMSPSQFTNLSISAGSKDSVTSEDRSWKYAVPNWIDVSFWSGNKETNPSSLKTIANEINLAQSAARARSELTLRCKMYELQMMGVTENEMSNISIPYLHEFYMHPDHVGAHDLGQSRNGLTAEKKTRRAQPGLILGLGKTDHYLSRTDRDALKWMDTYDAGVFRSHQNQRASEKQDRLKKREIERKRRSARTSIDGAHFLGTSFSVRDKSPGQLSARLGSAFFDRQMKNRDLALQSSKASPSEITHPKIVRTPSSSSLKSPETPRKFSFNVRGFNFLPQSTTATAHAESVNGIIRTEPRATNKRQSILSSDSPFNRSAETSPSTSTTNGAAPSLLRRQINAAGSSEPINIKRGIDVPAREELQSVRSRSNKQMILDAFSKDQIESKKLDGLQASLRTKQLAPKIELVVGSAGNSSAASSYNALAPWLTILNPLNPKDTTGESDIQFKRWQHIYPKPLRLSSIKWKSLCSPAAIPITTECFPSARQLVTEYTESPYTVSPNEDPNELSEAPIAREALLMELISMRLCQGFQIVVGPNVVAAMGHIAHRLLTSLDALKSTMDGATIIMTMGNVIHQIVCMEGGDIQIKKMIRKPPVASGPVTNLNLIYRPLIRTRLSETYIMQPMRFGNLRSEYSWNYADSLAAGYETELDEQLRFWRARFVLIPCTPPPGIRRTANVATEDSDEEVRIEGIRKLSQMIQQRVVRGEDEKYSSTRRLKKDANPLGIIYQTRDASAVIKSELQGLSVLGPDESGRRSQVFSDTELFQKSSFNLSAVAQEMQGSRGIKMQDRRWHWRLHWNCFIGEEFTTWLLENFEDVETRDEAVELGNELMKKGLFKHVEGRHQFRDGNYFYQLSSDFSASRSESKSGWFSSMRSVPSTPMSDQSRDEGAFDKHLSEKNDPALDTPTATHINRSSSGKIQLSKMLRYDVDPRKKSARPEIINLHYDMLHNPDSCYHLRLEWMNVTPKLIEDVLVNWTSTLERYGMRLLQVPIAEASAVSETNPFRAPYPITLAASPPDEQPARAFEAGSLAAQPQDDPLFYHKAVLRKLDFVLDMEAASSFPPETKVSYSWGAPSYKHPQYIHRSGIVVCQIRADGVFLLVDNQRSNSRPSRDAVSGRFEPPPPAAAAAASEQQQRRHGGITQQMASHASGVVEGRYSPYASPHLRATAGDSSGVGLSNWLNTTAVSPLGSSSAEQIKDDIERFCHDGDGLRAFYDALKAQQGTVLASPESGGIGDESRIPVLGLPPSLGRGRAGSLMKEVVMGVDEEEG